MPPLGTTPEEVPEEAPELAYDIVSRILKIVEEKQDPWRTWRIAEIRKIRNIVDDVKQVKEENTKLKEENTKLKAEIKEDNECESLIMEIWANEGSLGTIDDALPIHYRQKKKNGEWGIDD